jgi:hypothetical protein
MIVRAFGGIGICLLMLACMVGCSGSEPEGNTAVPDVQPSTPEPVTGGLKGPEVKIGK